MIFLCIIYNEKTKKCMKNLYMMPIWNILKFCRWGQYPLCHPLNMPLCSRKCDDHIECFARFSFFHHNSLWNLNKKTMRIKNLWLQYGRAFFFSLFSVTYGRWAGKKYKKNQSTSAIVLVIHTYIYFEHMYISSRIYAIISTYINKSALVSSSSPTKSVVRRVITRILCEQQYYTVVKFGVHYVLCPVGLWVSAIIDRQS